MKTIYSFLLPFLVMGISINVVSAQTKEEVVALVKQTKSEIEKKFSNFYKNIGVKIKKINYESPNDTISFLDFFIQIFIPDKLK